MVFNSVGEGIESAESGKEEGDVGENEVEAIHKVEHGWEREGCPLLDKDRWGNTVHLFCQQQMFGGYSKINLRKVDARQVFRLEHPEWSPTHRS